MTTLWIGKPKIHIERLPKTGDREDFILTVTGPGEGEYRVPLSITGTVERIWQLDAAQATAKLAETIFDVRGTASAPPVNGFWFDSYGVSDTLQGTLNKITGGELEKFVKNTGKGYAQFGGTIGSQIEALDKLFLEKYDKPFFQSLEEAHEQSAMVEDLNTEAKSNADYLYRVCILSNVIDHIAVEPSIIIQHGTEKPGTLQKLKQWLGEKCGEEQSTQLTQTFQMIKNLRRQYPLHRHFENRDGILQLRSGVKKANDYFDINHASEYGKNTFTVINKFSESLKDIHDTIQKL